MTLWFDAIEEEMPDTLRGRLVYRKHDSTGVLQSAGQDLAIAWRRPAKKEKEKEKEKKDDAPRTQPVQGEGSRRHDAEPGEEHRLRLRLSVDPGRQHSHRPAASGRGRKLRAGESLLRAGHRQTALVDAQRALGGGREIPSDDSGGTFANTNRESNDTLRSEFTIESPEKYGTLILNVKGKTPQSEYVIEVLRDGRVQKEIPHVRSGTHTIRYVDVGTIKLRFIEDLNGNGKWDTGSVFERRQPSGSSTSSTSPAPKRS